MVAGPHGRHLENWMKMLEIPWVENTKMEILQTGNDRSFSRNVLFTATDYKGTPLIIKQFGSFDSYLKEQATYKTFSGISNAFKHFVCFSKFHERHCLVMRKLNKLHFRNDTLSNDVRLIVKNLSELHQLTYSRDFKSHVGYTPVSAWIENIQSKEIRQLCSLKNDNLYEIVLIHGDLYPNNILKTEDGQLCFIDWEKITFSVFEKDLASLFVGIILKVGKTGFIPLMNTIIEYTREYKLLLTLIISEVIELKKIKNFGMRNELNSIYSETINLLKGRIL